MLGFIPQILLRVLALFFYEVDNAVADGHHASLENCFEAGHACTWLWSKLLQSFGVSLTQAS
jgi:hypothetical protein